MPRSGAAPPAGRPALDLPAAVAVALAEVGVPVDLGDPGDLGARTYTHAGRGTTPTGPGAMSTARPLWCGGSRDRGRARRDRSDGCRGGAGRSIRARIAAAGGDPSAVRIVAMTKGFDVDACRATVAAGVRDLGENYADELLRKAAALGPAEDVRWHFAGAIQTNKLARLAPYVGLWQTVDSADHAAALARRARGAAVLVQVDLTGAPGRNGCPPEDAVALVGQARDLGLDVRGFMAVGPDPAITPGGHATSRATFAQLRTLAEQAGVTELSMGMSGDLEDAVAEGATMVRIGTALFGPRPSGRRVRRRVRPTGARTRSRTERPTELRWATHPEGGHDQWLVSGSGPWITWASVTTGHEVPATTTPTKTNSPRRHHRGKPQWRRRTNRRASTWCDRPRCRRPCRLARQRRHGWGQRRDRATHSASVRTVTPVAQAPKVHVVAPPRSAKRRKSGSASGPASR